MSSTSLIALSALLLLTSSFAMADGPTTKPTSVLDFSMNDIKGNPVDLSKYKGKVLLIVNTASKCGNTPQYDALEKLNEKYGPEGLAVLGFPCNDFHAQEPGTEKDILAFCELTYHVKFDMFSKVNVKDDAAKGEKKTPLFAFLTSKETNPQFGGEIKWNFNKFLIDRNGNVVGRFEPPVKPDTKEVVDAIEAELAKK